MRSQVLGKNSFEKGWDASSLRSACSALRCATGLATIQTPQKVLPDRTMKPIFSTSFRKDFIRKVVHDRCIHRHTILLCLKNRQFVTEFLSGFCPRIFAASLTQFFYFSVDFFSLFLNFLSRFEWFFPLQRPVRLCFPENLFWVIFGLFSCFSEILCRVALFGHFWVILLHNWSEMENS